MAETTLHAVQPFVQTKKGRVSPGPLRPCLSAEIARLTAERIVKCGSAVGALAFSRTGDPDFGEFDEPQILATVGEIPADAIEVPF